MPKIPRNQQFEPSSNVIKTWYGTRKDSRQYSGVVLPGLFSTHNFAYDFIGFVVIVALEVWGILNLMIVGQFGFIMALGLFLADLVFAIGAHWFQTKICRVKNLLVLHDDFTIQTQLKNSLSTPKVISFIFKVLVVSVALFKIMSFQGLHQKFDGLSLAITLSYAIVAMLHIACTGYFFWELTTRFWLWWEVKSHLKVHPIQNSRYFSRTRYIDIQDLALQEFSINGHSLRKMKENSYRWETVGILTDEDLDFFVNSQPQNIRGEVAKKGLYLQVNEYLGLSPQNEI